MTKKQSDRNGDFGLKGCMAILFLLFIGTVANTQPPMTKYFGDSVDVNLPYMIPFQDSSFFLAGRIVVPGSEISDSYFVMTDTTGTVDWVKRYNFGVNEIVRDLDASEENLYVLVYAANTYHSHIVKLNASGETVSSFRYLGEFPFTFLKNILVTDNGIICSGWLQVDGPGSRPVLVKMDFNGNVLWTKRYEALEETGNEDIIDMIELSNGDFLISGNSNSYGIGIPTLWGMAPAGFLMRVSSIGDLIWAKGFDRTHNIDAILETSTSDLIVQSADLDQRMLVHKMSGEGDVIWSKILVPDVEGALAQISSSIETVDNNYLFYGGSEYLSSQIPMYIKMDPDGNIIWQSEQEVLSIYSPDGEVFEMGDGGFLSSYSAAIDGEQYFGLTKTNNLGDNPCTAELVNFVVNDTSIVPIDMDFDLTEFTYGKSTSNFGEFIEVDFEDFYCCDTVIAEIFFENEGYAYNFYADPLSLASHTWIIGEDTLYGSDVDFTFSSPGTYTVCQYADNLCSQDSTCLTIEVLLDDSGLATNLNSENVSVYPLPFDQGITIDFSQEFTNGIIQIRDYMGRVVYENHNFQNKDWIDLNTLTKGVYFLQILTEESELFAIKILKE